MTSFRNKTAAGVTILLVVSVFAYFLAREPDSPEAAQNSSGGAHSLIETSLLQTAVGLAASAATPDEQANAREAWRLADHELDLAFAAALRQAGAEAESATSRNATFRGLNDRIANLKARVEADKKRIASLSPDSSGALDLAHAQLDLDQDELDDAQQDLARQGGDKRVKLQQLLLEHEASDKIADQTMRFGSLGATGTMSEQVRVWFSLRDYRLRLQGAEQQAALRSGNLLDQHHRLERELASLPDSPASLQVLRQLSAQHKTLAGIDQGIQDTKQLAGVYQQWGTLVERRQHGLARLLLRSFVTILAIILTGLLLNRAAERGIREADRRRIHQWRAISKITLQLTALLMILLVVFGPPTQVSTMIGLITAGLTVVMKDFIVAFFGWFTLMGKDGIRVGDWVEIEGVSGEVIEIGLLKTVLLELGNWTATGLPTGRRVAFSNTFAMERHYFNFSTSGQWLWDELRFVLPPAVDPYETTQKIRDLVERETQSYAGEAAREWEKVTRQYGARDFSAAPAINLRPGGSGLEVGVRYITRAPERGTAQAKLLQGIVELLRSSEPAASNRQTA